MNILFLSLLLLLDFLIIIYSHCLQWSATHAIQSPWNLALALSMLLKSCKSLRISESMALYLPTFSLNFLYHWFKVSPPSLHVLPPLPISGFHFTEFPLSFSITLSISLSVAPFTCFTSWKWVSLRCKPQPSDSLHFSVLECFSILMASLLLVHCCWMSCCNFKRRIQKLQNLQVCFFFFSDKITVFLVSRLEIFMLYLTPPEAPFKQNQVLWILSS